MHSQIILPNSNNMLKYIVNFTKFLRNTGINQFHEKIAGSLIPYFFNGYCSCTNFVTTRRQKLARNLWMTMGRMSFQIRRWTSAACFQNFFICTQSTFEDQIKNIILPSYGIHQFEKFRDVGKFLFKSGKLFIICNKLLQ